MLKPLYCNSNYLVSDEGYVLSKKKGTPLKYSLNHNGYCMINIMMPDGSRKGMGVHSAVLKTFTKDETINGKEINHIDGNKENNSLQNLEWVTPKENVKHSIEVLGNNFMGRNNPNAKIVYGIDPVSNKIKLKFDSVSDAARYFASDESKVKNIKTIISEVALGRRNRHTYRGLVWKY